MPFDFNLGDYAGEDWGGGSFTLLPTGTYSLRIKEYEQKENNKKNGRLYQIQFEVADGDFKGHEFRHWVTSHHENQKAERMGRAELADICRVLQVVQPEQWVNQVLLADLTLIPEVKNKAGEVTKQGKNKITEYRPYGQPGAPAGGPPPLSPQHPMHNTANNGYQAPPQNPPQTYNHQALQNPAPNAHPGYPPQNNQQAPMNYGAPAPNQHAQPNQPAPPSWANAAPQ